MTYSQFRAAIADILDPRCYEIEHIDAMVETGLAQVFANADAIILTEIKNYPAGAREIHGIVAAGDLGSILPLIDEAEAWGAAQGCEFAGIASREGWAKALQSRGYSVYQVEIRKELG